MAKAVRPLEERPQPADTLEDSREPNSSAAVLEALDEAERAFSSYQNYCRTVDNTYSLVVGSTFTTESDNALDMFWASMEILKPAIYAKPPKPLATPRFKDGGKLEKVVAELIERCLTSAFDRGDVDGVMLGIRDDLALTNRGVAWVTYETDEKGGGQRVCIEHLDRTDFLHEPARKWADVGWVARRGWMTKRQMEDRFPGVDLEGVEFHVRTEDRDAGQVDGSAKAGVWEVWSKVDNKVYWVARGCHDILDEDEPHLNLQGFFPCPKPAYGTIQRRSLVPVPDYKRYQHHLDQINELTSRIYALLEQVRLKVFIPAGGDMGEAIQAALDSSDETIIIPVNSAALFGQGSTNLMVTLPLVEIATTIQGLIEARTQLISDFYQLSGISDIMRGATEAQETLGAQQLKTQYGSVRVRDKIDELARIARDVAEIAAEIMAQNFSKDTLLDLSRMTIPTRAELTKKRKEIEEAAKGALKALAEEAREQMQPGEGDPEQMQQAFQARQMEVMAPYQSALQQMATEVVIEDVMDMLRDNKARNLIIDIETDSTILTDEMAEKHSRAEFLQAFNNASVAVMQLMQAGEPGAKLAGGIIKFALQPYRANRELDALVDEFVDNAGQIAQQAGEGGAEKELAQANQKLAEAEMAKAQAQAAKVQADSMLKMQELERKQAEAQAKMQADQQKGMIEVENTKAKLAETEARIRKINAEIEAIGVKAGVDMAKVENDSRKTDIDEFKAIADAEMRQTDQAMRAVQASRPVNGAQGRQP